MAATLEQGCILESSLPLTPNDTVVSKVAHVNLGPKITNEDWQKEQADDPHISRVLELMKQDKLMSYKSTRNDPSGLRVYLKFRKDLVLKSKLLYQKVADKWEQSLYLVVKQMGDRPVFKIWPLDSNDDSRDRILHRNMLFPLQLKVQTNAEETTTVLSKANQLMDLYFDI